MVQAARSGVQNIAEGSQASGTSKKTELKLTNVARASLEELKLDYEDFLRQRGKELWEPEHPALSLLNLCCYLLDRQIKSQAKTFEKEGGFTERLYWRRSDVR
jgi:four helix bundle suffix protein